MTTAMDARKRTRKANGSIWVRTMVSWMRSRLVVMSWPASSRSSLPWLRISPGSPPARWLSAFRLAA